MIEDSEQVVTITDENRALTERVNDPTDLVFDVPIRERVFAHLRSFEMPEGLTHPQREFLRAYSVCGVISQSASFAGIKQGNHFKWMKESPLYTETFERAKEHVGDFFETEVVRRAFIGWEEPVYQQGRLVGYTRKYDGNLLAKLVQAHKPERYGNKVDVTSKGEPLVRVVLKEEDLP